MTRAPDSGFQSSNLPGWQPTAPAGLPTAPLPPPPIAGHRRRAPQRRFLTDQAHVWLARLPPRFQPLATARAHPHIVNRLAELWPMPDQLADYFRELLFSRREGRRGFSFDVLTELLDLQSQAPQRPH